MIHWRYHEYYMFVNCATVHATCSKATLHCIQLSLRYALDWEHGLGTQVRQALAIGFANRLARRMMSHNGYKTYNENATLAQLHPGSSNLRADIEGLYPEWVVYHELVTTSRPFLRQVFQLNSTLLCLVTSRSWIRTGTVFSTGL